MMLTCDICGGVISMQANGAFCCETCGISYTKEALSAKLNALQAQSWEYAEADGGIEIQRWTEDRQEVQIPECLDGKPVISLGKGAFYEKKKLLRASLPDHVKAIGRMAFCNF